MLRIEKDFFTTENTSSITLLLIFCVLLWWPNNLWEVKTILR